MLKKFSVKNFKNFKEEIVLDFEKVRDYEFNQDLIKNGLVNKMLIYGPNNSGKSNLGAAIMDITTHLTDNYIIDKSIYTYYINGDCIDELVEFKYEFLFNDKNLVYKYKKDSKMKLISEELLEDDKILFKYNYTNNKYENNIPEAQSIDISKKDDGFQPSISVLKYIYTNTIYWPNNSTIKLFMDFVNNMLWFKSLKNNEFINNLVNGENINEFIINNNLLNDFQNFLNSCGQDYKLCEILENNKKEIGVEYKNFNANFNLVASTGTQSLCLFYYWLNKSKNISFIYLDEFDAFYHYELSAYILKYINSKTEFQSILTSHNTYLITNELMRPDCYSILKDGMITSFADSTNKTIRQAHNLEKMMLGGEFEK